MGRAQWHKLPVSLAELCIDTTLRCGQSFRWRKFGDEWRCSLHGRILSLRQDAECVYYQAVYPAAKPSPRASKKAKESGESEAQDTSDDTSDDTHSLLRSYFNLQLDLAALYAQWSRDDANFRAKAPRFSGIRILNQDAWEALVCFICSSNNNIARISQMAHKLCLHYGPLLGALDGEPYHDFPSPAALAAPGVEGHLRQLGFGYRAKYIAQTAHAVCVERRPGWLARLRNPQCPDWPPHPLQQASFASFSVAETPNAETPTYKHAQEQLLTLSGVGPKVSDCVCLMGLGWGAAVPVDTHVWQIAVRDYKFKKQASKTFSKGMHDAVGDHFRRLWGDYAGWAQSVLFTANLRAFSDRLKGGEAEGEAEGEAKGEAKGEIKADGEPAVKEEDVETHTAISDSQTTLQQQPATATRKRKTIKAEHEAAPVRTRRRTGR